MLFVTNDLTNLVNDLQLDFNSHYTEMLFVTGVFPMLAVELQELFQFSLYWDAFCNMLEPEKVLCLR